MAVPTSLAPFSIAVPASCALFWIVSPTEAGVELESSARAADAAANNATSARPVNQLTRFMASSSESLEGSYHNALSGAASRAAVRQPGKPPAPHDARRRLSDKPRAPRKA